MLRVQPTGPTPDVCGHGCTHVPSVQSRSRVPVPSPVAVAQKEEASPPASPHHGPGVILGLEKRGRQQRAGGCCGSGWAMPPARRGRWRTGKEEHQHRPVPRAPAQGTGKEDPSHLKRKRGVLGNTRGGSGSPRGDAWGVTLVGDPPMLPVPNCRLRVPRPQEQRRRGGLLHAPFCNAAFGTEVCVLPPAPR